MSARDITVTHEGVEYSAQVATVKRTLLGWEDHGIFTAQLTFEGDSWGQMSPGYFLDRPDEDRHRAGTAFGLDQVMRLCEVVGVRSWEEISGSKVLVLRRERSGVVDGIAHLSDEGKVFIFKAHCDAFRDRERVAVRGVLDAALRGDGEAAKPHLVELGLQVAVEEVERS